MHAKKLLLGPDFDLNDVIKGVTVPTLAIEMRIVTAVKDSVYGLGLYAAIAWLSEDADLVVILSANLMGFLCSGNRISGASSAGGPNGDGKKLVCCVNEVETWPSTLATSII